MEKYLKIGDYFGGDLSVSSGTRERIISAKGEVLATTPSPQVAKIAAHAINSHDELVAEVERLRRQLAYAFMAGWEEGVNGMECDEAEVASVDVAEQFARN